MKIAVIAFGKHCNIPCLSRWIDSYQTSGTDLEAVLIYDDSLNPDALNIWPYDKKKSTLNLDVCIHPDMRHVYECSTFFKADIMKMYAFNEVGSCIVIDYDAFIMKKICSQMIPSCSWAMAIHNRRSKFFNCEHLLFNLVQFDEYDCIPYCNIGVQIVNENYFDRFIYFVNKYLPRLFDFFEPTCFMQQIASLTLRDCNGTILLPEWNWYPDSKVHNRNVIIEHHYGPTKNRI